MGNMGISLEDILHRLRRRAIWISVSAVLAGVAAAAINKAMPLQYTSEALLQVEAHSPLTTDLNPGVLPTAPDQVRTEAEILQSRALADAVVSELNLATAPGFTTAPRPKTWLDQTSVWLEGARSEIKKLLGLTSGPDDAHAAAVTAFQQQLVVVANEKSHIVAVRFRSGSPALSAKVINTLLTKYLANQVSANRDVASRENQWLAEHLAALQRDVDQAAAQAQSFREKHNLVDISAGSLSALQLNQKEQDLSNARLNLAKLQADYDTATNAAQSGTGFTGQEVLGSPLIQRLRDREGAVLERLANLSQRYGDRSPYLRPVEAELSAVRQQIANETDKIINALGRNVKTAQIQVGRLEAAVGEAQAQARVGGGAAAVLAQLNQQVEAKRHVYNAFLTRMEQTQLTSTQFPVGRVVSAAVPPAKPDGLPLWIVASLGMIVGVFLSSAVILLRLALGERVSSVKDIEAVTGITPIGSIPALPGIGARLPIAARILDMSQSNVAETLYALSFAIQAMNPDAPCTRVLVTSPLQGEGKTTVAASLARLTAAGGMRVLLIEADLRRPTLRQVLRISPEMTIESVLLQKRTLADAVRTDPKSGLHYLVANGSVPNPVKALQSARFSVLMDEAQACYDMVIMDSPPVMHVVDPLILTKYSDVILFAVAFGRATAPVVAEAVHRFPADARSRIATVLTKVPKSEAVWLGYYAGYRRKLAKS